ncbi:T9SS type A sorting domain-containing protein [Dyadobacter sp. LHD-138]|uniref:T9SS type A sorting domain-containing protein n=1 Tax=Dyadobacter sp. LHD-138 TaxID=3071413 RepID=UPI0027DFEF0D|nr:T9SS type A sorting domain-containing protein [Dyadobacter sp. LHD-138]MDQ6478295.1 T9SS type A sorting domain-containing protein [Dyadobacter sp. LHD-138]
MKTFYSLVLVCVLLCTAGSKLNASGLRAKAKTEKLNKVTVPARSAAVLTGDLCNCGDNVLKNPSFENNDEFEGWTKSGSWSSNTDYDVCGDKAVVLKNDGNLYQDVPVVPGTKVDFSIFGGYHAKKGQTFKLTFYTAAKVAIPDGAQSIAVDWDVDNVPNGTPILKKYVFNTATAPANAAYVRAEATSLTGDWFKVDAACMKLTIACDNCAGNLLLNPSFEEFNTVNNVKIPKNWSSSNDAAKIFTVDDSYEVCGTKNGLLGTAGGSFWQDVNTIAGSNVTLTIWGGYHSKANQKFQLIFYSPTNVVLDTKSVDLNKTVEEYPRSSPKGLTQYSLSGIAPVGTKYVRVLGSSTGNYLKVDAACLKITPPTCETCTNNVLANPSFENGTASWTTVVGTFAESNDYVVCGVKSGKLTGKSTIAQEKEVAPGSSVTFSCYAGFNTASSQLIKLRFLNAARTELSTKETAINKVYTTSPFGLQKFTVSDKAPLNTKYVSIEIVSSGNEMIVDLSCVTVEAGTPLPVTLTDFKVKKEGTAAILVWNTTSETNAKEFEVQHSLNGKQWEILGVVGAEGESSIIKSYTYTHAKPAKGSNLYRLRMVDQDATFAFSRIVSERFVTEESVMLYPNPSSNFMKLQSGNEKVASIQIYDVRGVKVRDFVPQEGNDIDVSSLAQGTYIVTFKQSSGLLNKQRIQIVR